MGVPASLVLIAGWSNKTTFNKGLWTSIFLAHAISGFECLEISEDIRNLVRIQPELGHGRMVRDDPLSQWPPQIFDRKSQVQRAKRRRDRERALAHFVNGMALRAIHADKCQPALRGRGQLRESRLSEA
jgi:hypothetical protein